jgi:hypothetical protein
MGNTISELLKRVNRLTDEEAEKSIAVTDKIIAKDKRDDADTKSCPHCGGAVFARNGVKAANSVTNARTAAFRVCSPHTRACKKLMLPRGGPEIYHSGHP